MPQVTFNDRLKFNAYSSYVSNPSRHVTNPLHHMTDLTRQPNTFKADKKKIWRAVDFAPRYHQVRLSSAKLNFSRHKFIHNRADSAKREALYCSARLEKPAMERNRGRHNIMSQSAGGAELNMFLTRFRPLGPRDDDIQRARTWRDYQTYPYKNPKPFDHRGVCGQL